MIILDIFICSSPFQAYISLFAVIGL